MRKCVSLVGEVSSFSFPNVAIILEFALRSMSRPANRALHRVLVAVGGERARSKFTKNRTNADKCKHCHQPVFSEVSRSGQQSHDTGASVSTESTCAA